MKKTDKELEKLSVYIDGEMSAEEASALESRIAVSPELQKKLRELKRLKELTVSSAKRVPESPYFETRVLAVLENHKSLKGNLRKFYPALGFGLLTVAVMVVLKLNPTLLEEIVEDQKSNIAGFYTENLKPLLFAADLNDEDIFNFAFYSQLPLDNKDEQFLQLGYDEAGNEYFEIKTASNVNTHNNFRKFVEMLQLDGEQQDEMDSIISGYAEELQSQVLVNERNTVAINPNIWNYQKAIAADILSFAKNSNEEVFSKFIPVNYSFYDKPSAEKIVSKVKSAKDNEYIFFTPDTIFKESYKFDQEKFKEEMELMKKELERSMDELHINMEGLDINMDEFNEEMEELRKNQFELNLDSSLFKLKVHSSWPSNFKVFIDSNLCRIHIDKIVIPRIELPDFDSLSKHIENITKHMRSFSFVVPPAGKNNVRKFEYRWEFGPNSADSGYFYVPDSVYNFNIPNLDSILKDKFPSGAFRFDSLDHFNFSPDSIFSGIKIPGLNPGWFRNQEEFKLKMKEFEEEMERLKEDLKDLKKDLNRDLKKDSIKNKKPVEI